MGGGKGAGERVIMGGRVFGGHLECAWRRRRRRRRSRQIECWVVTWSARDTDA
jgi:hypothetical protein